MKQFLGRARYRRPDEGERGYRNGYGKPRQLTTRAGTVTVRRPRVRGLEQRFESAWLPLFARRTPEVSDVLSQLYLHRLALGDFELALRGLFGEGAPLAASTVARVKERWHAEADEQRCWNHRIVNVLDQVPKRSQEEASES